MKKKLENVKGITLIALVITIVLNIIVLLILAGVTIATLTGENGIVTQALNAKTENRGGTIAEEVEIWKANKEIDNNTETITAEDKNAFLERLVNENKLSEEEKNIVEETRESNNISLKGADGYNYGVTILDEACEALYSSDLAQEVRM